MSKLPELSGDISARSREGGTLTLERTESSYARLLMLLLLLSMLSGPLVACSPREQGQSVVQALDSELEQARVFTPVSVAVEVQWDSFMNSIQSNDPAGAELRNELFGIPVYLANKIDSGVVDTLTENGIDLDSVYVSVSEIGGTGKYAVVLHNLEGIGYYRVLYDSVQHTAVIQTPFSYLERYDHEKFAAFVLEYVQLDRFVRTHRTRAGNHPLSAFSIYAYLDNEYPQGKVEAPAHTDQDGLVDVVWPFWLWQPIVVPEDGGELID